VIEGGSVPLRSAAASGSRSERTLTVFEFPSLIRALKKVNPMGHFIATYGPFVMSMTNTVLQWSYLHRRRERAGKEADQSPVTREAADKEAD